MIDQLTISNLGVIPRAQLNFSSGLTILTGETGAGKTMVLSSIALLLGKKADPALVRYGEKELAVEGIFVSDSSAAAKILTDAGGIVEDGEIILARTVPSQGRSRCHGGGRTIPSTVLAEIGRELVTVHGQSEQLGLRSSGRQLALLDSFGSASHLELVKQFKETYASWRDLQSQLQQWENQRQAREIEVSRLKEGVELQEKLQPELGEEDELLRTIERLGNVEDLREAAQVAYSYLAGGSTGEGGDAASLVGAAIQALEKGAQSDEHLSELARGLRDASSIILDISAEAGAYLADLQADPGKLDQAQRRLAQLRHAYRPWAKDLDSWLTWADKAREKIIQLSGPQNQGAVIQEKLTKTSSQLEKLGKNLTHARLALAADLKKKVAQELNGLQMPGAGFDIELTTLDEPNAHGYDQVTFGLRAGKDASVRPLGQGASGGELSRIMLALEVTLAASSLAKGSHTFIFDEVDAGIGGQTALAVGQRLARLAQHAQVIVVTHLPQVAAWADKQLVVSKNNDTTRVEEVAGSEREREIARMLAGKADSQSALDHARELISACRVG